MYRRRTVPDFSNLEASYYRTVMAILRKGPTSVLGAFSHNKQVYLCCNRGALVRISSSRSSVHLAPSTTRNFIFLYSVLWTFL